MIVGGHSPSILCCVDVYMLCCCWCVQEVKEMGQRVTALESERSLMQPQLAQMQSLREKVVALEQELLVLSQLYNDKKDEVQSLKTRSTGTLEQSLLTRTLKKEKEGVSSALCTFIYTLSIFYIMYIVYRSNVCIMYLYMYIYNYIHDCVVFRFSC